MSTPFSDITKLMVGEMNKHELFNGTYETNISLEELAILIQESALVDFRVCRKNLEKYVGYSEKEEKIVVDMNTTSMIIDTSTIDDSYKESFIVFVNGEEVEFDYEFIGTNLVIRYYFKENDVVKIIFMQEGYFEEDLSFREKYIIALGCCVHMTERLIQRENGFIKKLGDKDYSIERRTDLISLKDDISNRLRRYLKEYDYDNMNEDDL